MEERTITIPLNEYKELIAKAERIAACERMIANREYVTLNDIAAALNINPINNGGKLA